MKKFTFLLVLLLVVSTLFLSGCKEIGEGPSAEESSSSGLDFE